MGSVATPANIMPGLKSGLIEYVSSLNPGQAIAISDQPVLLPFPARYIRVVSCNTAALPNTAFFHLAPMAKKYTGTGITLLGNECWVPLGNSPGGNQNKLGFWLKFCNPISQFLLDLGFEAGAGVPHNLTFLISNSVEFISDNFI